MGVDQWIIGLEGDLSDQQAFVGQLVCLDCASGLMDQDGSAIVGLNPTAAFQLTTHPRGISLPAFVQRLSG